MNNLSLYFFPVCPTTKLVLFLLGNCFCSSLISFISLQEARSKNLIRFAKTNKVSRFGCKFEENFSYLKKI